MLARDLIRSVEREIHLLAIATTPDPNLVFRDQVGLWTGLILIVDNRVYWLRQMILGLTPLVFATGVATLTRRGVGTAVFGGMIAATALGVFVIPLLYVVFQRIRSSGRRSMSRRV